MSGLKGLKLETPEQVFEAMNEYTDNHPYATGRMHGKTSKLRRDIVYTSMGIGAAIMLKHLVTIGAVDKLTATVIGMTLKVDAESHMRDHEPRDGDVVYDSET